MDNINEEYKGAQMQLGEILRQEGFVLLGNFLEEGLIDALGIELGESIWTQKEVPDEHRYEELIASDDITTVFDDIKTYFESVVRHDLQLKQLTVRRFTTGSFTLQHDTQPEDGLHIAIFLCSQWDSSFRGELTYVPEEGEPLIVLPQHNSALVVEKHEPTRMFVKRVTHYAQTENYIVLHAIFR